MALPYSMVQSDAWRNLSGPALKVWIELRSRYNGGNNGELHLSFSEAAKLLHLGKSTIRSAYKELQDKGFIIKTKQGQWYGRQASEYQVTDQRYKGKPATRDWKAWRPKPNDQKIHLLKQLKGPHMVINSGPSQDSSETQNVP